MLIFVFSECLVCIFVRFCVCLDHFSFVLLVVSLDLFFFSTEPRDWLGRTSPKLHIFVSKGTLSFAPSCIQITAATRNVDVISLLPQVYRPLQQVTQSSNLLEKLCLRRKHRPELHCLVIS